MVTDREDRDSNDEDIVMHPLIHLEDSDDKENGHGDSPSKPLSLELTREPVHSSEKYTEEPTSAPNTGNSQDPSAPTREDNKGKISPGVMARMDDLFIVHPSHNK